jgi:hypothetical protein
VFNDRIDLFADEVDAEFFDKLLLELIIDPCAVIAKIAEHKLFIVPFFQLIQLIVVNLWFLFCTLLLF